MGAVDLVVQVEAPPSVAAGLQRVGRAGHQVGAVSRGVVFPKHRGDLLSCAVVAERMAEGAHRGAALPAQPARRAGPADRRDGRAWTRGGVDDLAALVRRAAPFAELPDSALHAVLDMLSGRYPSTAFAELRPRLVWDRATDLLTGRPGAQRLAVTSGGTIPDRGLFGVFLAGAERAARVGELDEEMVYESRVGDVFLLGSTSWRIEEITPDRVLVSPAPGQRRPGCRSGRATSSGRPVELGRAIGARLRALVRQDDRDGAAPRCAPAGSTTGRPTTCWPTCASSARPPAPLPDDRTVVVERFRDELGDWRLAVHCVLGARVNGPWALAIGRRLDRAVRRGRPGDALRRRHRGPAARHRRRAARRRPGGRSSPTRSPSSSRSRSAPRRCSPPGSASAPPGRCCCPAATRAAGSRCGSSASAPPSCSTSPASTPTSRSPWRPPGSACRTSSTCPAWSG